MSDVVALSLYRRGFRTSVAIRAEDFDNQYWMANWDDVIPRVCFHSSAKIIQFLFR